MDELIIGSKTYISSKRAAEITGYAKDYVGQLCREGHVEARMVGRSWYVLDTSIRAHRFGTPEKTSQAAPTDQMAVAKDLLPTWETPTYVAELVPTIPPMPKKEEQAAPFEPAKGDTTIAEMQSAWKEWFESRTDSVLEVPGADQLRLESPDIVDARQEGHDKSFTYTEERPSQEEPPIEVPFTRLPETAKPAEELESKEEVIPIRKVARVRLSAPKVEIPRPRPVVRTEPKGRPSLVTTTALVAVAGIAVAIGIIGSGFASPLVADNAIVQFLGGASTINK